MEGDLVIIPFNARFTISIHSLRMEGDEVEKMPTLYDLTFQSTPSAWRETENFRAVDLVKNISIHSLRMEGDTGKFYSK